MNKQILRTYLKEVSKNYYDGHPTLSDDVFDRLAEIAGFDEVGAQQGEVPHLYRLQSLEKFYPESGDKPNREFFHPITTPKLDGACIAATYISGKLVQVLTRGNGIKGRDITDKIITIDLVPKEINDTRPIQVTFEVVAPKTIENARNYVAGALNLKDVLELATRELYAFVHGIEPSIEGSFTEDMSWLYHQGFNTVTNIKTDFNQFPQDGVVVRENNYVRFKDWGITQHHPKGAYALKVRKEAVQTKLLDVVWQVGKSGKVTPVAQLDPVDIDGAMVSKASLHNIAFIENLELEIGDTVELVRSGEIIPYIIGKVES